MLTCLGFRIPFYFEFKILFLLFLSLPQIQVRHGYLNGFNELTIEFLGLYIHLSSVPSTPVHKK